MLFIYKLWVPQNKHTRTYALCSQYGYCVLMMSHTPSIFRNYFPSNLQFGTHKLGPLKALLPGLNSPQGLFDVRSSSGYSAMWRLGNMYTLLLLEDLEDPFTFPNTRAQWWHRGCRTVVWLWFLSGNGKACIRKNLVDTNHILACTQGFRELRTVPEAAHGSTVLL